MRSTILGLSFALAASALAPAQWAFNYSATPNVPIPSVGSGGAPGSCSNVANKATVTIQAPDSVRVTDVDVSIHLWHTYAHDLRITLIHGGTSVVLFDQYPTTVAKAFQGIYSFSDESPLTIAASVTQASTLVPSSYQPQAPLSALDGSSTAGPWTLEICDLAGGDIGVLYDWSLYVYAKSYIDGSFQSSVPIPDGGAGGCFLPVTRVINVPPGSGPIAWVQPSFWIYHTRVADLTMTVTHGLVSVVLCSPNTPPSNATLNGWYGFDDGSPESWAQALTSHQALDLPAAQYRPDAPLSAFDGVDSSGPWFFTVCDGVGSNTGLFSGIMLEWAASGFRFDLSQPAGSSSIVLKNTGGTPGNQYLNAFTLVPGSFPAGWLNGLDISMTDLVTQVTWGVPFFGQLDASGSATVTIPGPIPPSLPLQFASFDIGAGGIAVSSIPARSYTTAP
jgi:subtilisin-like proprotein convertase family protein